MLTKMVSICWPRDPPASASQSAGITGLSHRARPWDNILTILRLISRGLQSESPYTKLISIVFPHPTSLSQSLKFGILKFWPNYRLYSLCFKVFIWFNCTYIKFFRFSRFPRSFSVESKKPFIFFSQCILEKYSLFSLDLAFLLCNYLPGFIYSPGICTCFSVTSNWMLKKN